MKINLFGHIDTYMESTKVIRISRGEGSYVDGIWYASENATTTHSANIQPLSLFEIKNLGIGAERVEDYRKMYINDNSAASIQSSDIWQIQGLPDFYKTIALDNRVPFGRSYCKILIHRIDNKINTPRNNQPPI